MESARQHPEIISDYLAKEQSLGCMLGPFTEEINDSIDSSLCSLIYSMVDEVAEIVVKWGRGTLLSKVDIESVYRLIPVHPQDCPL